MRWRPGKRHDTSHVYSGPAHDAFSRSHGRKALIAGQNRAGSTCNTPAGYTYLAAISGPARFSPTGSPE